MHDAKVGQHMGNTERGEDSLRPALLLVACALVARLSYSIWFCPYDLVEDEAHYWLWSRHLDWSYYSKGPGIAWVIWLSTKLFGHAEWAIRIPTVLASAIGALACAGLARDVARCAFVRDGSVATPAKAAIFAAALFMLAPAFQLTGVLVTIDGCYLACWACACWAAWRAFLGGSLGAWAALGAAIGAGFLFKYTILLLLPGLLLFTVLKRARLRLAPAWWAGLGMAIMLVLAGLAPVVYWNAREGWPTIAHLLGHLGMKGGDVPIAVPSAEGGAAKGGYNPLWTVNYLLAPFGMFGPVVALGVVGALRIVRRRQATTQASGEQRRLGASFLLWCAAPILIFYLIVSFMAEPEQNWAIAGFVPMMALAGWYAADELSRRKAGAQTPVLTSEGTARTRPIKVLWRLSIIYGLCALAPLHRADLLATGLNSLMRVPSVAGVLKAIIGEEPRPIVVGRLIGPKRMAAHVGRVLDEMKARDGTTGPWFVMAEHYGRASQMAYYLFRDGRGSDVTPVFSTQSVMGGRKSQFDYWTETSLLRRELAGGMAVLLSNNKPNTLERWRGMFERVEPLDTPDQKLDGEHKKDRVAWIGTGYRPSDGQGADSQR